MKIGEAPVIDVRGPLTAQRGRLLSLLASLDDVQWAAPTVAPHWLVKDITLHLLDVDLSWIARDRDHDQSGVIPVPADHEEFVRGLTARNQRWLDGTRVLSPRLVTSLLGHGHRAKCAGHDSCQLAKQTVTTQVDATMGGFVVAIPG